MKLSLPENLNGYHVFGAFAAFFGVVFAVNGFMVFMALDSWSGLSTEDAYQRGLRYNTTLEAMEHRDALGWQENVIYTPGSPDAAATADADSQSESYGRITLEMRDRDGALLEGLIVAGQIWRPTNEGFDRPIELEAVGAGRYETDVAFPLKGNWLIRLSAQRDPNRHDIARADAAEHEGFIFGIEKRVNVQ
ncbi:FixH family protein [Denitrobaculum tricleocarpae]|uniref:FixH family protein n=1 Tax=Denitrobaculum tricleocarpae TaxID=2591009 RepID=A0A545ST04_9PROT|nr:FixH family protein [Denitrobaculum tricleocarpae]TQV68100.1 FixH family protein [Denitrobaculum tricleocarpae]